MSNIKWEDGAVCFSNGEQWGADNNFEEVLGFNDLQLNEIIQGDYIEASELCSEQKYNNTVEEFELFGFNSYLNNDMDKAEFIEHAIANSLGFIADKDGDLVLDYAHPMDVEQRRRKITYPQLMAIGKLKRAMIERDEVQKIDHKNTWVNPEYAASDWSDKHYNYFYQLTKEDIERGEVKVDAYFVNRMWKINSWEDTGAGFHILKTLPRIANNKNSLNRELVALKKQVDILCKLHGVDDKESK